MCLINKKTAMEVLESEVQSFARQIGLTEEELIKQSLLSFVWTKLQSIKVQIIEIQKKYQIETVFDFERLYEIGAIEEADTREDMQKFDRLSYELEMYENFFKRLI